MMATFEVMTSTESLGTIGLWTDHLTSRGEGGLWFFSKIFWFPMLLIRYHRVCGSYHYFFDRCEQGNYYGIDHLTCRGGGYGFLFRSEYFFRTTQELEYFFFVAQSANFFPLFNIRLYDKNSESDYFFLYI
jgi:hypothetical protein